MGQVKRDIDVQLFTAAGVAVPLNPAGYVTLVNATTYYAEMPVADCAVGSMFWSWAAALVAAITFETTNLPPSEANVFDAAGALWFPETAAGTTSPAAAAGCALQSFANTGSRRMRCKIVVTTGGTAQLRGRWHGKAGT